MISVEQELKVTRMYKRSQNKKLFGRDNYRLREFVLQPYCIRYFEVSGGNRGKEKGQLLLSNVRFIERIQDDDLDNKKNVFQIAYTDEALSHLWYLLYIVANSSSERDDWISLVRFYTGERGAMFLPRYHPGVWKRPGRYSCCDDINRRAAGCQATTEPGLPPIMVDPNQHPQQSITTNPAPHPQFWRPTPDHGVALLPLTNSSPNLQAPQPQRGQQTKHQLPGVVNVPSSLVAWPPSGQQQHQTGITTSLAPTTSPTQALFQLQRSQQQPVVASSSVPQQPSRLATTAISNTTTNNNNISSSSNLRRSSNHHRGSATTGLQSPQSVSSSSASTTTTSTAAAVKAAAAASQGYPQLLFFDMDDEENTVIAVHNYNPVRENQLPLQKGEKYFVVNQSNAQWWYVRNMAGQLGYVPTNYVHKPNSLASFDWYYKDITRQQAEAILLEENREGCFLVRDSVSKKNTFTLSVVSKDPETSGKLKVHHYHIHRTESPATGTNQTSNASSTNVANGMTTNGNGSLSNNNQHYYYYYLSEKHAFPTISDVIHYHKHNSGGLVVRLRSPPTKDRESPVTAGMGLDEFELDPIELQLDPDPIGKGQFGVVKKGRFRNIPVAVKQMVEGAMNEDDFIEEAKNMRFLNHPNLVQLFGVVLKKRPIMIITEYMKHGSLRDFMRQRKSYFHQRPLVLADICAQVANGMAYLEQEQFVHRDLAARNCLVKSSGSNSIHVKVADFGMARFLLDNVYEPSAGTKFPVRWAPPEVFQSTYTAKADVWSFAGLKSAPLGTDLKIDVVMKIQGEVKSSMSPLCDDFIGLGFFFAFHPPLCVLVWEVFTCCLENPYQGMNNTEVYKYIVGGGRLLKPAVCPDGIYILMVECWQHDPNKRPAFEYICQKIGGYLDQICEN